MTEQDIEPWYKQFWPWFVIALLATAVVASLNMVFLAFTTKDSLVTEAPDGMDVVAERQLAAEGLARDLDLDVTLNIDLQSGAITAVLLSESDGNDGDWPKALSLEFSHPTNAGRDVEIALAAAMPDADGNPVWAGHLVSIPSGRHYVVLQPEETAEWRLNGEWTGQQSIRLQPTRGDEPS